MSLSLPWRRNGARAQLLVSCLLLGAAFAAACGSDSKRSVQAEDGGAAGEAGHAGDGSGLLPGGTAGAQANGGDAGAASGNGGAMSGDAGAMAGDAGGGSLGLGGATGLGGADAGSAGAGGVAPNDGLFHAISVTAGYYNSFAVELGTRQVWAWGYQVDALTGGYNGGSATGWAKKRVAIAGLTGVDQVIAVSEGSSYYAHHTDGTVSAWGLNTQGQLGDQTTTTRALPVQVLDVDGSPMRGVCFIAAGAHVLVMARAPHCSKYAVGSEPPASITGAWVVGQFIPGTIGGTNNPDYPSNGAIAKQFTGLPAGVEIDAIAMPDASASTEARAVFSLSDGSRYAWGNNGASNPLGAGTSTVFAGSATTAVDVGAFWSTTDGIELGRDFAIAHDAALTLSGVGRNLEGQLGTGNDFASSTLIPVLNLSNVSDFSVGQVTVTAITNGQLWTWGWDGSNPVTTPTRLGAFDGFTRVSQGDEHGLAIGPDHRVYVWGGRSYGALGDGFSAGRAATPTLLVE